jgi:predicted RNA-binding Zn-ribbon protein involved in translation (DUF1610 family)
MEEKKKTAKILYCNECTEPLENTMGKMVCPACGIAPPVQDIYIKRVCRECHVQVRELASSNEYFCPICNQVLTD